MVVKPALHSPPVQTQAFLHPATLCSDPICISLCVSLSRPSPFSLCLSVYVWICKCVRFVPALLHSAHYCLTGGKRGHQKKGEGEGVRADSERQTVTRRPAAVWSKWTGGWRPASESLRAARQECVWERREVCQVEGVSSCMTHPVSDCFGWQSVTSRQPFWSCWTTQHTQRRLSFWLMFSTTTELVIYHDNVVDPCFKGPVYQHLCFQSFWLFRCLLRLGITWCDQTRCNNRSGFIPGLSERQKNMLKGSTCV